MNTHWRVEAATEKLGAGFDPKWVRSNLGEQSPVEKTYEARREAKLRFFHFGKPGKPGNPGKPGKPSFFVE